MTEILKKYICIHPFNYIDIQPNTSWVCCPSWCPTNIQENDNLMDTWQSDNAKNVRKSVYDGSYSYCKHNICPSLSTLIHTGVKQNNFLTREEFAKTFQINSIDDIDNFNGTPEEILFGFDRSCNLRCPSCRSDFVINDEIDSNEYKKKLFIIESIEKKFGAGAKRLLITGSGDPFYSKIYRDYLINFDETKYPKLEQINIITNGNLLDEKMWDSLNSKKFIKSIEISIDAGTKNTYENITRLNGNWNRLINNLKFLSGVNTINYMVFSMVVSEYNFLEMKLFYDLITEIFSKSSIKIKISYRQHVYWQTGAYSLTDTKNIQVFNPIHPKYKEFLSEFNKINNLKFVDHNFHQYIN